MPSVELKISGNGGEFQHHLIGKPTLKKILTLGKGKGGAQKIVSEYFEGGKIFDKALEPGVYGCAVDSIFKVNGKSLKAPKIVKTKEITDDSPDPNNGHFYYFASGVVSGVAKFEVTGSFDSSKLTIESIDYKLLENWKAGALIERVIYDGHEIDIEWIDDGLSNSHVLCVYSTDKKGKYRDAEIVLMLNEDDDEWVFDGECLARFLSD